MVFRGASISVNDKTDRFMARMSDLADWIRMMESHGIAQQKIANARQIFPVKERNSPMDLTVVDILSTWAYP